MIDEDNYKRTLIIEGAVENFRHKRCVRSEVFLVPYERNVQLRIGVDHEPLLAENGNYSMKFWLLNSGDRKQDVVVKFQWHLLDKERNVALSSAEFSGLCDFRFASSRQHGYCFKEDISAKVIEDLVDTDGKLRMRFVITAVNERNEEIEQARSPTEGYSLPQLLVAYYKEVYGESYEKHLIPILNASDQQFSEQAF